MTTRPFLGSRPIRLSSILENHTRHSNLRIPSFPELDLARNFWAWRLPLPTHHPLYTRYVVSGTSSNVGHGPVSKMDDWEQKDYSANDEDNEIREIFRLRRDDVEIRS